MTSFSQNFEGGTNGSNITAANSGTAPNTAFAAPTLSGSTTITYASAAAVHGSLGMAITYTGAGAGYIPWTIAPADSAQRTVVRFYVTPPTGTTSQSLMYFRNASAQAGQINIDISAHFQLINSAGSAIATATTALTGGTTYRVEAAMTPGATTTAGIFEITVYTGDTSTVFWSTTVTGANLGAAALTTVRFGASNTPAARTMWFDDLALNDSLASGLLGPTVGSATVNFSAGGSLGASGAPGFPSPATLSGSGTLSTSGVVASLTMPLSTTGTLAVAGTPAVAPAVALSTSGTLTAAVAPAVPATTTFTTTGTLSVSGTPVVPSEGPLSATGTLTATAAPGFPRTVAFSSTGTLATSGKPGATAAVGLSASGTLSAVGAQATKIVLTATGTLAVAGKPGPRPTVGLSASGALAVTATPRPAPAVALTGSGTLSASGSPAYARTLNFSTVGTLTVVSGPGFAFQAGFSSTGALAVAGKPGVRRPAAFGTTGTLRPVRTVAFTPSPGHAALTSVHQRQVRITGRAPSSRT